MGERFLTGEKEELTCMEGNHSVQSENLLASCVPPFCSASACFKPYS